MFTLATIQGWSFGRYGIIGRGLLRPSERGNIGEVNFLDSVTTLQLQHMNCEEIMSMDAVDL